MRHTIGVEELPDGRWRVYGRGHSAEGPRLNELLAELGASLTVNRRLRERVEANRDARRRP